MTGGIEFTDILHAANRIAGSIRSTPLDLSRSLTRLCEAPVYLKHEHHQITGSFKLRGATNALLALSNDQRKRGVIGVSTGNFGRALAHAAKMQGVRCVIALSHLVPENKVEAIRSHGAEIHISGKSQDEAQREVERLVATDGLTMLHPFDMADVITGQGTLGREVLEALPDTKTLLVPLSGGGLLAGVALAAKTIKPSIRIVGISMERGAAMAASLKAGHPVDVEELPSLADSLGGGIGLENRFTFQMLRSLVDDVVLLEEEEIAAAIRHLYFQEGEIVEGAAAVGVGALLAGKVKAEGPTVALLTGKNIDMTLHQGIISNEQPKA